MRIVVLAGGISPERNVSLSSGTLICRALREMGHRAVLVDAFLGIGEPAAEALFDRERLCSVAEAIAVETPDLEQVRALRADGGDAAFGPGVLALCSMADIVFLGLHGQFGEDGRVQAAFDLLGIPYTGSGFLGSAAAMDKDFTKRIAASAGIRTPAWTTVDSEAELPRVLEETELPCVVKPVDGGSSIGVSVARDRAALAAGLHESLRRGERVMLERYIDGRELQIAVLGDRALPSIEIIPRTGFYDYKNKYQPGAAAEICPAEVPGEVEAELADTVLAVHRLLGLSVYSRADFLLSRTDGLLYFLEINTLPGMTPTSLVPQEAAAAGISYGALCARILELSLAVRRRG